MNNQILRNKVRKAFDTLRKKGYTCKEKYLCCQNCAWHALTHHQAKKAIFWHKQDEETLRYSGKLYLAWSGDGDVIYAALKEQGLTIEWDGTENTRFKVTFEESCVLA